MCFYVVCHVVCRVVCHVTHCQCFYVVCHVVCHVTHVVCHVVCMVMFELPPRPFKGSGCYMLAQSLRQDAPTSRHCHNLGIGECA